MLTHTYEHENRLSINLGTRAQIFKYTRTHIICVYIHTHRHAHGHIKIDLNHAQFNLDEVVRQKGTHAHTHINKNTNSDTHTYLDEILTREQV